MKRCTTSLAVLVAALSLMPTPGLAGSETGQFCKAENFYVRQGEIVRGDRYVFGKSVDIAGLNEGDLIGWAQSFVLSGEVTGDVFFGAQTADLRGTVRDSTRLFAATTILSGLVEGDLLVFTSDFNMHPGAVVTGNLVVFAGTAQVDGSIGGDVRFGGGEIDIRGTVEQDVELQADAIQLHPEATILGNLSYTSRKELTPTETEVVRGTVEYSPEVEEEEEERPFITLGSVMWWLWWTLSSLLVGFIGLALFRRAAPALLAPIHGETMLGTLIGFGIFLVVPAASLLAMALVIALPLGVISLMIFLVALYLAKMPVAIWVGRRILGAVGSGDPSPFAALAVGIPLLYLLFEVPFYLGTLVWLISTWLGLGAILLAARNALQQRGEAAAAE
jgi:cytoskeletal protein CcmA (bactofilin family)